MSCDDKFITHLLKGTMTKLFIDNVSEDCMMLSLFDYFFKNPDELNYKEWDVLLCACWFYMTDRFTKLDKPKYRKVVLNGFATSVDLAVSLKCTGYYMYIIFFMRISGLFLHLWHKILQRYPENISQDEKNDYKIFCNKLIKRSQYHPSESIYVYCGFAAVEVIDRYHVPIHPKKDVLAALMNEFSFNQDEVERYDTNPLNEIYTWFKEVAEDDIDKIKEKTRSDVVECIEYLHERGFDSQIPLQEMIEEIQTFGLTDDSSEYDDDDDDDADSNEIIMRNHPIRNLM